MKKLLGSIGVVSTLVVAFSFARPEVAAADGGCPPGDGWALVPLEATIDADVGNFHDQNGDGLVCRRINKGQSEKNGAPTWTVKDNTNPAPL